MEENTYNNIQPILEEENHPDKYVTIFGINITSEMNASNIESTENEKVEIRANEHYNLRPRPKSMVQYTLTWFEQQ